MTLFAGFRPLRRAIVVVACVFLSSASAFADTARADISKRTSGIEAQLGDLHAKLKITAAQEPTWRTFAESMRGNARRLDESSQSRVLLLPTMSATENMRSYARISMQQAQHAQGLIPAFDALYRDMSVSQRATADQIFRDEVSFEASGIRR